MRRFVYLLLFIFAPGNALLKIKECGGEISALLERSGSILYPSHPDSSVFNQNTDNGTTNLLDVTCTWIIDSNVNQTVWIEVISLGNGSYFGIKFGNEDEQTYKRDERAVFSGTGKTIIQWRTVNTSGAVHLRWNTSDSGHDPALIPYTHSDANPVSPSPSGSRRVTYTPDIPGRGNVTPKTHTPRGESVQRARGVSDPTDKSRPLFPQENTNNEQETAGERIFDLSHVGTNSYTETHSGTDTNSASNTHEPFKVWSSTAIHSLLPSLHTTPKQSKTSTLSLLDRNDVTHTEKHTGNSQCMDTHPFTKDLSNTLRAKREDFSSMFPTASFLTVNPHNRDTSKFKKDPKESDLTSDGPNKVEVTTLTDPNTDLLAISERIRNSQSHVGTSTITHANQPIKSETDKKDRFPMSDHPNTVINDDLVIVTSTPVVSEFPSINQSNPLVFSDSNTTKSLGHLGSVDFTIEITERPINVTIISTIENEPSTLSRTETIQPLISSEVSTIHISQTIQSQHNTSTQQTSSGTASVSKEISDLTSHNSKMITATLFTYTKAPDLSPAEGSSASYASSSVRQNEKQQERLITTSPSFSSSGTSSPQMNPNVTSDLSIENITAVMFHHYKNRTDLKEPDISPSQVQKTISQTGTPKYTATPQYSPPSLENTQSNVDFSVITHTSSQQTADVSNSGPTRRSWKIASSQMTQNVDSITTQNVMSSSTHTLLDITSTHISAVSIDDHAVITSTPVSVTTSNGIYTPSLTTKQSTMTTHATSTENPSVQLHTNVPVQGPSTIRAPKDLITSSYVTWINEHAISTQVVTQTSRIKSTASSSDRRWPHGKHFFIVEDQPAIIKEDRFQVLLQITLEDNFKPSMKLLELEPFLHSVSGYKSQHVTWHSGPVLQTVLNFQTVKALSWLGRAESLLEEAGLKPLPMTGVFVGGVKVKNIIVGGLHTDVCEWLFECPSGFQCVSSKTNISCTSVCHSDYCKHQGICVHRPEQQPVCQCPVGDDYWFMGQRCDLRMTRPRLVGVCFAVLIAIAAVMALLSYLAVRRFKSMLMQAKVEQTRSSYRRFNHFDELSARFWGRSWPGSDDSLDNPVFTRSDELLHLRALDRTCCYHDDTLSVVSTYHGSGTHLNTVYPHSSQYGWDLSNCSLADGVVDSGKASDLSVCSWPVEPIQWTPFPLLQQLNKNTNKVKVSRPRSYCEGMELVDLEKSWTA